MVKKWSPDSSVSLSIRTTICFPWTDPTVACHSRPPHPLTRSNHCFLTGPAFSCLWAIACTVPHPTLSTHLWTYSQFFEVQVRLCCLHEAFLIFSVGNNIYFFNSQSCLFVQQGITERVCVALSICSRQIWWISVIAVSQVPRQEPSTWQVLKKHLSERMSESWCVLS